MAAREQHKPNDLLRQQRRLRGWSLREVAHQLQALSPDENCAVNADMVGKWELGKYTPSPFYQAKLCELYQLTAAQLGFIDMFPIQEVPAMEGSSDTQKSTVLQILRQDIIEAIQQLEEQNMDRRNLLHAIFKAALLTPFLGEIQQPEALNTVAIEKVYPQWVATTETFWDLYFTGGIPIIETCLPSLLSELTAAACQPSRHQKQVMALASQAYQIHWLLSLQRQDFGQALLAIDQAYIYAKEAEDANLELASLVRKAHVYFHLKNPVKQLSLHEQAAQRTGSVSPLMCSWLYLLLAENHASLRHDKEAVAFLDLAHETLPNNPTQDETCSYIRMNAYLISNFEILCQLHLSQPRKALNALEHLGLSIADPRCSELLNHQLMAFYMLNELDELCRLFAPALQAAHHTRSNLRYHEVCSIYSKLIAKWPKEQKVREIAALFQ